MSVRVSVRVSHGGVVLGGAALDAQVVAHEGLHLVRVRVRARVRVGVAVGVGDGVTVRVRVGARLDEGSHIRRSARERLVVRVVLGVHVELDAGPRPEGDRRDLRYRVGGWGHIYSSVVMARVRVRDRG